MYLQYIRLNECSCGSVPDCACPFKNASERSVSNSYHSAPLPLLQCYDITSLLTGPAEDFLRL